MEIKSKKIIVCVIAMVLVIAAVLGILYYYNNIGKLSDEEKKVINLELTKELENPLLASFYNSKEFKIVYDENVLKDVKTKYWITLYTMLGDTTVSNKIIKELRPDGTYETGGIAIDTEAFMNYYYNIFNEQLNEGELLNANIEGGITIKDNKIYGQIVTGWGYPQFIFKSNKLKLNKKDDTYTLYVDLLKSNSDGVLDKYNSPEILNWDDKSIYSEKLEIEYKKDSKESYKLLSIVFKK